MLVCVFLVYIEIAFNANVLFSAHYEMDSNQDWIKYFTRWSWTVFSSSLTESWKVKDKIRSILVLLYALMEGIRLTYVWRFQDLESSLRFGAIYHPLGATERAISFSIGILIFESFVLQCILWFNQRSLLSFHPYLSLGKQRLFHKESKFIFTIAYWPLILAARFFQFVIIGCGLAYMYLFFTLVSVNCLQCIWDDCSLLWPRNAN